MRGEGGQGGGGRSDRLKCPHRPHAHRPRQRPPSRFVYPDDKKFFFHKNLTQNMNLLIYDCIAREKHFLRFRT